MDKDICVNDSNAAWDVIGGCNGAKERPIGLSVNNRKMRKGGSKHHNMRKRMLSASEADALTERIRAGNEAEIVLESDRCLNEEKRKECERVVQDGRAARDEMAIRTRYLPYWLVTNFFKAPMDKGQYDEMVASAAEILAEVICSGEYSSARGSFSHYYAVVAGRGRLYQIYNESGLVKVPNDYVRIKMGLQKACDSFYGEHFREATEREQAVELLPDVMRNLNKTPRKKGYSENDVRFYRSIGGDVVSLDESYDDEGYTLHDTIAAPLRVVNQCECEKEHHELRQLVEGGLSCLSEREREIVVRRYYLADEYRPTLQELGESLGISKQRVSQVEKSALAKLASKLDEKEVLYCLKHGGSCEEYAY